MPWLPLESCAMYKSAGVAVAVATSALHRFEELSQHAVDLVVESFEPVEGHSDRSRVDTLLRAFAPATTAGRVVEHLPDLLGNGVAEGGPAGGEFDEVAGSMSCMVWLLFSVTCPNRSTSKWFSERWSTN